ncbi:type III secretion system (T3SS) SseB-like protein [Rhodovulum imhoffii]|uniref:Type III secretion system (T3SS) SseB-like protein n=1 Tax=Rhodovulum imhoffii TaxID=365340 RepID=A0A2T5BSQ6_9RHOB|nr:SseB family protein [Rhodovulum imhoffii]MBK5934370.1 hypothetical protein [Rhodovulum imhoffii]PTN02433.1 type III secretion system (T3SS) SseB-like protein [Rhodovulum imhoffii]
MTRPSPLDEAHAAMQAAPADTALRLRYFERLANTELFLLLESDPEGGILSPRVFPLEDGPVVLAFDSEARLAAFTGAPTPFAGLPGRALAGLLAGQGLGLGVNLEDDNGELLPPKTLDWLADVLSCAPQEFHARPEELTAPKGLPEPLLPALDSRLATAAGLSRCAWLAGVRYGDGNSGHLLAFIDAAAGAEAALSRTVSEALTFSGAEAGALDVAFFRTGDAIVAQLARVGLRFDLPTPDPAGEIIAPDPDAPPRLR